MIGWGIVCVYIMDLCRFNEVIQAHKLPEPIYVTRPTMPSLDAYVNHLQGIWDRKWLTNAGPLHEQLQDELCRFLGVQHISLFCNGTIALLVALEALRINDGEVITTPFSFPATAHSLYWSRIRPVFADIDPQTFNLDPGEIERHITPATKAILAVHVYGHPCNVEAIREIAERHGLRVIYDAAHSFGVIRNGRPLAAEGNISMLSFHATKLFSTIEGGALIADSKVIHQRIDFLKNFGIADEETVIGPGINGKMNEFQAAFGLLQLASVPEEIARRREISAIYRDHLAGISGIEVPAPTAGSEPNYAYFPILVDSDRFGCSRDELNALLRACNIFTRRYFYPLITKASCYAALASASATNLPVATRISSQVLCLPMYGRLAPNLARSVCAAIRACHAASTHSGFKS